MHCYVHQIFTRNTQLLIKLYCENKNFYEQRKSQCTSHQHGVHLDKRIQKIHEKHSIYFYGRKK